MDKPSEYSSMTRKQTSRYFAKVVLKLVASINQVKSIALPVPEDILEFAFQELASHSLLRTIMMPCSLAFSLYLPNANVTDGGGRTSRASLPLYVNNFKQTH